MSSRIFNRFVFVEHHDREHIKNMVNAVRKSSVDQKDGPAHTCSKTELREVAEALHKGVDESENSRQEGVLTRSGWQSGVI